jgi:hypothetical protein
MKNISAGRGQILAAGEQNEHPPAGEKMKNIPPTGDDRQPRKKKNIRDGKE